MKNFINKFKYFILGGLLLTAGSVAAVQISVPAASSAGFLLQSLSTGLYSTVSLTAGSNITISTTTSNITISGTGGGSSFPFTSVTGYNSTSTVVGFLNGLFSTASTTFSGNFFLPALTQGSLYTGTNGKVGTTATTSVSCSGSTSCTTFTAFGSSPVTITSSGGGSSFGQSWELNSLGQLAPTTTVPILVASPATSTIANFGSVLYASQFAGADIYAQAQTAYAWAVTNQYKEVTIVLPNGKFSASTRFHCDTNGFRCLLMGSPAGGTEIDYTGSATSTIINSGIQNTGIEHTSGCGISNITLVGNSYATSSSPQVGLQVGGNNGSDCTVLTNVNIEHFGYGLQTDANLYHFAWYNGVIRDNGQNVNIPFVSNNGEGLNFFNAFIIDQANLDPFNCLNIGASGADSISFYGGSIDDCQINQGFGTHLSLFGTHMENPAVGEPSYPFIVVGNSAFSTLGLHSVVFVNDQTTNSPSTFIQSNQSTVIIDGVIVDKESGSTVATLVTNSGGSVTWNGYNNTNGGVTNVVNSMGTPPNGSTGITSFAGLSNFTYSTSTLYSSFKNASSTFGFFGSLTLSTTSAGCAAFMSSGLLTSTGVACGSGGGSGTVNSGLAGELGWYASNGTTISATTTDGQLTLGSLLATSSTATSQIGTALFNGVPAVAGLGTSNYQLEISRNINNIDGQLYLANTNMGANAVTSLTFGNGNSTNAGASSVYIGGIVMCGPNFATAGFGGCPPNGLAMYNHDGGIAIGALSTNPASSTIDFYAGNNGGFGSGGLDMTLRVPRTNSNSGGNPYLGLGTTSPQFLFTASASNTPQYALEGNNTDNIWTERSIGNQFYIATASPTTYATSSVSAFSINSNGFPTFPSLSGVGCAQFTSTGQLANTGSGCGSSSGLTSYDAFTHPGVSQSATTSLMLLFGQASTSQLTATSSVYLATVTGKVGIGTTNPAQKLEVDGSQYIAGGDLFFDNGHAFEYGNGTTYLTGETNSGSLSFFSGGVNRLQVDGVVGAVGIGTTTPKFLLDLASSTRAQISLEDGANNSQWSIRGIGGQFYIATSSPTTYATSTRFALNIDANGILNVNRLTLATTSAGCAAVTSGGEVVSTGTACGSGGGSGTVNSGVSGQTAYYNGNGTAVSGTSTMVIGTTTADFNNVGIGTTTPYGQLSINPYATFPVGAPAFVIGSSTGTSFSVTPFGTGDMLDVATNTANTTYALAVAQGGFGTTTLTGLTIALAQATSTSNVGFNITTGCYAIGGTCLTSGGSGTPGGSNGQVQYNASNSFGGVSTSSIANGTNITVTNGSTAFVLGAQPTIGISGVIAFANGGTGAPSFTTNQLTYSNGTALVSASTTAINNAAGFFGIGTSTPAYELNIASTTAPQLVLSGASTDFPWFFRSIGGSLYIGTTSPTTFATSSTAAITLSPSATTIVGIGTTSPTAELSIDVASSSQTTTLSTPFGFLMSMIINGTRYMVQTFDYYGHRITSGPTPTITGGTSSVSGNDNNGTITVVGTALTSVTLTFAKPWANAPDCTESDNSTALTADITSISTTQVVFGFSIGVNSGTVWYSCVGHQ